MKVVLFCGGQGLRMREHSETIPKPMVPIGYRPILWHVMRYYAHFGHRDFILCLGYRADAIKDYFLHYDEARVQRLRPLRRRAAGRAARHRHRRLADHVRRHRARRRRSASGCVAVRHLLEGEEMFLANYGDILTDAPLDGSSTEFRADTATAALPSVRALVLVPRRCHRCRGSRHGAPKRSGRPTSGSMAAATCSGRRSWTRLDSGEDLVDAPFAGLAAEGRLSAYPYDGFWVSLDTLKDLEVLQHLEESGDAPWAVWRRGPAPA